DRREPDVRDLVELLQLLHHHGADRARADLALGAVEELLLDALRDVLEILHRDGALLTGGDHPGQDLPPVELLAALVALDDAQRRLVDALARGETSLAAQALAAAADHEGV